MSPVAGLSGLVRSVGMYTALGEDRASSCTALRSGIGALALTKRFQLMGPDPEWDPPEALRVARVPSLSLDLGPRERLLAMSAPAISEALRAAQIRRADLPGAALLLAVPAGDAATQTWDLDDLADELVQRAGLTEIPVVEQRANGHATAIELLHRALELLRRPRVAGGPPAPRRVVVIAADTYVARDRIRALDQQGRLASRRSPEGFSIGEAAVALVIEADSAGQVDGAAPPLARLAAFGFGDEPDSAFSDRAPMGQGTEAAILGAWAGVADGNGAAWVLSDMNGEPYRAMDWGAAVSRLGPRLDPELEMSHPADAMGDVGCASGALLVAIASDAFAEGRAPADRALVVTSSDGGARAAARVEPL